MTTRFSPLLLALALAKADTAKPAKPVSTKPKVREIR